MIVNEIVTDALRKVDDGTMRELRVVDERAIAEMTDLLGLRVVFKGNLVQCDEYARQRGYYWRVTTGGIFGGYYVDSSGEALLIT